MPILGVSPSGEVVWLALVFDDERVAANPDRFALPSLPRPQALTSAIEDIEALLQRHGVRAVATLDAQANAKPGSYKQARARFTLELLFEFAAARSAVPYELLAPGTVQSRLGLRTRKLDDHVNEVVTAVGTRWNQRGRAALAGVAALRGGC